MERNGRGRKRRGGKAEKTGKGMEFRGDLGEGSGEEAWKGLEMERE